MSKMERDKGARIEREIVNLHRDIGIDAERVPLSGAARYQGGDHDLDVYPWGRAKGALRGEVKGRANGAGFTLLERWLGNSHVLFLRRDRQEPLVLVPWHVWADVLAASRSTSTRPNIKYGRVDTTYAKRDGSRGSSGASEGESDEHFDEA